MKKCILILGVVIFILLLICLYFVYPLQQINQSITYANKNNIEVINSSNFISAENFNLLKVDDFIISDEEFANVDIKTSIKDISAFNMKLSYDITVEVNTFTDTSPSKVYKGVKELELKFDDFNWQIVSVK